MHQAVRVCHIDHTDRIIAWIACSIDLPETLYYCTLTMVEIEVLDFMHQAVRVCLHIHA